MELIYKYSILYIFIMLFSTTLFANSIQQGKEIFYNNKLANCSSCHSVKSSNNSSNSMGPTLNYLSLWPKKVLFDKIYDSTTTAPNSIMPPFGKNGLLTKTQIDLLVSYLKTIN